jgi:hypothetical protein
MTTEPTLDEKPGYPTPEQITTAIDNRCGHLASVHLLDEQCRLCTFTAKHDPLCPVGLAFAHLDHMTRILQRHRPEIVEWGEQWCVLCAWDDDWPCADVQDIITQLRAWGAL